MDTSTANLDYTNPTGTLRSPSLDRDESRRYRDLMAGEPSPGELSDPRYPSSSANADINSSSRATNSYRRYSKDESGNESGSDTSALLSNQHVLRTKTFKVPSASYISKGDSRPKGRSTQPKQQGEYGRILHDSFHSGHSQEIVGSDDDDEYEGDLEFAEDEEAIGMMTGSRSNRSGIGNRHGHDTGLEAKLPDHGGSLFSSFLNMANSIIGAGIIGLPFAFQEAGLGMGVILLCVVTWIVDWTVGLLVHSGKLSGRTTYQDLLMFCFGKAGLIMISIFQFIFAFGAMCAYTVIVGDTLPHVIQALVPGIETWPTLGFIARRSFVIIFCTILISFPLSLYRDISKLAKTSAVAMVALVVIIIAVIIEGPRAPAEIRGDPDLVWSFARPKVFQSIGVISFAFVCHHNSFLIFGSLQKPTMNRVKLVTHMSMMVSLLACMILALSGYLSFSNKTQGNILNNFPSDNFLINIARFCFGVNMFTTLPLEAFVCREVIETYYFPGEPFSMKRHSIITTGLVGIALIIALLTCDLGFVLEVTGGFSATALAFILPPLCYLKLASGSVWSMKKLPHLACLGFGIAVMILSTFFSLQHFMEPKDAAASTCSV